MALLKLQRHAQVIIPADLRRQFNLQEGDDLEAEAVKDGILLRPVSLLAREQAWPQIREAMAQDVDQESSSGQSDREQEEEIAAIPGGP